MWARWVYCAVPWVICGCSGILGPLASDTHGGDSGGVDRVEIDAIAKVDLGEAGTDSGEGSDGDRTRDVEIEQRDSGFDAGVRDAQGVDAGRDTGIRDVAGDHAMQTDTGTRDGGVRDVAVSVDVPSVTVTCRPAPGGGTATVPGVTLLRTLSANGGEGWLGSAAVVDLDGDGHREVLMGRGNRIVAWRGDTGAVRFSAEVNGNERVWAAPVVGDLSPEAGTEIVAAAGDRAVVFDANGRRLRSLVWREELRAVAGGDLDGDGRADVVVASTVPLSTGGRRDLLMAWRGDGTVMRGFPPNTSGASRCDDACDVTGGYDQNLAIGAIDGDAQMDVLAPMDNAYVSWHHGSGEAFRAAGIFRGVTRVPGVRALLDYTEAQAGYSEHENTSNQAHFTNTAPAIVDLDGDGETEIVLLSSVQNAAQTDRQRGVALWVLRADASRPSGWTEPYWFGNYRAGLVDLGGNIVAETNQVAVADVDGRSAGMEMVFADFDGNIRCVGADRSLRWTYRYTSSARVLTAGVAIADVTGDGRPEVVFATYSTEASGNVLVVLDGNGNEQRRVVIRGRGSMATPTVADVDGDGDLEITVSLKDGAGVEAEVWTVPGSAENCLPWPTGRANLLRNGAPGSATH